MSDAGTAPGRLKAAQKLHGEGKIDAAIAEAWQARELQPDYVPALTYLGTTLITRRLAFQEGLALLERAVEVAPDDAGALYSLGWCEEFIAYRLGKQLTTPFRDPYELYAAAARHLQACIDLNPEQKLQEDAEDLLASIEEKL